MKQPHSLTYWHMNTPECTLRDYQLDMQRRIAEAWKQHRNVMAQMPTGTGKTHLLAAIVRKELEENGGKNVWIVAHRRELVEQIERTVARHGIRREDGLVKAMSIQWLARNWEKTGEKPTLIVIDEAHHALAESYKKLWKRYPDVKKLGMTATPCRLNRKGFTDLFGVLVASRSIAEFIGKGWLSVFDYVSIRPGSNEQKLVNALEKRGADGDYQVKEMERMLNRRPTIERLYESIRQYADGKKGIVYAISIAHARNIAAYYTAKGIPAVEIDSKTPAMQRRQLIEEFRQGKTRILVNVDVFSEGFDCPDAEFVQLTRPTLSLAKYLQQVGRGLRKAKEKESCMLIDNVGLYRLFGLPTLGHDWQAMFEGRMAGKGQVRPVQAACDCAVGNMSAESTPETDEGLEVVMQHEKLLECLLAGQKGTQISDLQGELRAFKEKRNNLFGLKRGKCITAQPQYQTVFDIREGRAAVRFKDGNTGIVDEKGDVKLKTGLGNSLKFLKDELLAVTDPNGQVCYMDLRNGKKYVRKPVVVRFGKIEMLKVDGLYCSRTRNVYRGRMENRGYNFIGHGFYLNIHDYASRSKYRHVQESSFARYDCICILENDDNDFYHFCGALPDGSIVIADRNGKYFHAERGKEKRYMACEHPKSEEEDFDTALSRIKAEAEVRAERKRKNCLREQEKKRKQRLAEMLEAVPFQSGIKWGLKLGERIIVPPIYRNIQAPVGNYCAFEESPRQWGVIMLDGRIVVEARYDSVEIKKDGTARLTLVKGKTKEVRLEQLTINNGQWRG